MPNADALFLVLEYMPGGVLMEVAMGPEADHAKPPFDTWQTREYFRQLCLGLEYLHENEVVHRDVSVALLFFAHGGFAHARSNRRISCYPLIGLSSSYAILAFRRCLTRKAVIG